MMLNMFSIPLKSVSPVKYGKVKIFCKLPQKEKQIIRVPKSNDQYEHCMCACVRVCIVAHST